jgi:hypothetical protein
MREKKEEASNHRKKWTEGQKDVLLSRYPGVTRVASEEEAKRLNFVLSRSLDLRSWNSLLLVLRKERGSYVSDPSKIPHKIWTVEELTELATEYPDYPVRVDDDTVAKLNARYKMSKDRHYWKQRIGISNGTLDTNGSPIKANGNQCDKELEKKLEVPMRQPALDIGAARVIPAVIITNCVDCPHYQTDHCGHQARRRLYTPEEENGQFTIPSWCPLDVVNKGE